ncbi:hypothetical protein C7974DRAFT_390779 [Boeremia exigua]|uniref:uncharacterized protein n=1 Tax=Boeremia exigua TaxID=749465 RepID=UPI001E8CD93B|nr:uncharacterized protein C7974DRAFT_390779 [Boeremia exigua]KAH6638060.1 hypothetical protein C7974DRAFT_390779 [Boeremia exigua]
MTAMYELDDIFGYMPFDHFLVDNWDPELILDRETQEQTLVETWISLGRHGRSTYIDRCMENGQIPVPGHAPRDLSAFEKRQTVDPDEWSDASAIWIRTWYGNEAEEGDLPNEEMATRASADAAYARLWQKALWPLEKDGFNDSMFGPYIFDDNAGIYGVSARDADDEVDLMDGIPSFILNALVRCPDAMEGSSGRDAEDDEELMGSQALLVVVADGEACEDGWVLLVAMNDRGQVLHKRVRCKASDVGQNVAFWRDGGEPLDIDNTRENVIDYRDPNQSGSGWDDG